MTRSLPLSLCFLLCFLPYFTGCTSRVVCHLPPSITGQPASQVVTLGDVTVFTVAASGDTPLAYQWFRNGVAIPSATQPSYLTPATQLADSGAKFSVSVTNPLGSLTSNSASLTVNSKVNQNVLFVARTGNDSNPGTIDQPFQTIQKCATTAASGWICYIRAGTYRETVVPNSGVTISAYQFEDVSVDGSDPVSGWSPFRGSIYKATVALAADDTNQIFLDNDMMTEARWPNGSGLLAVNWSVAEDGTNASQIVDSALPSVDWTGAKIHLWSGSDPFGNETGVVTQSGSATLSIQLAETATCPSICPVKKGLYYLFGVLNALDADGEWYYDPQSTTLYFQAPGGVDPTPLNVRAKKRQYAFDLRGRSDVTIRNIGIFASTIITDASSSGNTLDRIHAEYVSHFTTLPVAPSDPTGSNFSILNVHSNDSGIILDGTDNTLENSTIAFSAGCGVAVSGDGNILKNNLIHDIDYIGDYDSGVNLIGNGNTVQFNTIYSVGRQAIQISGVANQDVGYNNLSDSMLLSVDGAEIYACCEQVASGTRVHHNWIHDTQSMVNTAGADVPLSGIYIDNGSDGFEIDQNVIWRNSRYNVTINGFSNSGPNTNNIHNNTIPDRSSVGNILLQNIQNCSSTQILNNRTVLSIKQQLLGSACNQGGNSRSASGANDMLGSPAIGCNFAGCSSSGPPEILDSGFVTPCPVP